MKLQDRKWGVKNKRSGYIKWCKSEIHAKDTLAMLRELIDAGGYWYKIVSE